MKSDAQVARAVHHNGSEDSTGDELHKGLYTPAKGSVDNRRGRVFASHGRLAGGGKRP